MKLRSYLSIGVVAGSFVLAGSMAFAQTANGSAVAQKKHVANVKYNDFKVQQSVKPQTAPGASPVDGARVKSHSNQTNNREAQPAPGASPVDGAKVKSHSNQTNNREVQPAPVNGASESAKPR